MAHPPPQMNANTVKDGTPQTAPVPAAQNNESVTEKSQVGTKIISAL